MYRNRALHIFSAAGGFNELDIISAAAIGTALAADAMAASFSRGMKNNGNRAYEAFVTASAFGLFQMIMPVLGWSIGKVGSSFISGIDHIIAFIILVLLGIKMITDSHKDKTVAINYNNKKELILLSFATSIDALASGIILPVSVGATKPVYMFYTVFIIGAITFILSYMGYSFGSTFRSFKPRYAEMAGGAVLILIGIKTLLTG